VLGTPTDLREAYLNLISRAPSGYCCLLTSGDQVQAAKYYDCVDDADAASKAAILLNSKPTHLGAEIWQGNRLVARIPRRERHRTTLR
jgi:hypothetical protein